jgi:uncharacterized membrane protein
MGFFNRFGDIILRIFSLVGYLVLAIPRIPAMIRNMNNEGIKDKIRPEKIKNNVSKMSQNMGIEEKTSKIARKMDKTIKTTRNHGTKNHGTLPEAEKITKNLKSDVIISSPFTSEEKESTVFRLQLLSAAFLLLSVLYIFNFLSLILYVIIGALVIIYVLYLLFNRVKLMYGHDFPAYRDFFLMYLAVGVILVLVGTNSNFVMAFSFQFLPSLTILIFALISVVAVFLIFRIRYYRKYTYGRVIETGKNTAYVKVEYDIRCNVKPDIYIVENSYGAVEGDTVKVSVEDRVLNPGGNKPIGIIETLENI